MRWFGKELDEISEAVDNLSQKEIHVYNTQDKLMILSKINKTVTKLMEIELVVLESM